MTDQQIELEYDRIEAYMLKNFPEPHWMAFHYTQTLILFSCN